MSHHRSKTSILSSLDYIEEGRRDIYKWGETRSTKRQGIRGWAYTFKKRFIDKSIIQSFLNNMSVSLLIQLILSALCTYTCQRLDLYADVHIALFVSPIIFPLAFSINADFQRREHVLEDLAQFKGGLIIMFFCHRDWHVNAGLNQEFLKGVTNKLKGLILNIKEYLLTEELCKRSFILQVIYEDFSDISQLNEKLRVALPDSSSLIQRVIHYHNLMFWAFERLRVVREYRSPRGIRSFTKVFIFVMPLLLSPYYVFVGKSSHNNWSPYYISLISTFVFGTLQGVQDVLDDPFDGISEDDVNLGSLEDWTAHSLLTNRTYTVGRFTVTASIKPKKETTEPVLIETRDISERNVTLKKKVNAPLRSILRKASHRTHQKPDVSTRVSEEDVDVLYPEMALQLQNMKKKGFTGSTTILPGFQIKEHPEDTDEEDSVMGTPVMRSRFDSSEFISDRRRAHRKNVSFSHDFDDEMIESSPERMSESSLNASDSFPLLHDRGTAEMNDMSGVLEPESIKFSKNLLESIKKLENVSGTERIVQAKPPPKEGGIPASLSVLFHPLPTQAQHDSPKQPVSSETVAIGSYAVTEKPDENKKEETSRFTVVNKGNCTSSNSLPKKPITSSDHNIDKKNTSEPRLSRFAVTPSTQASSATISTIPSRFAVTPSTQASVTTSGVQSTPARSPSTTDNVKVQLPSKTRFQVKSASSSTLVDEKLGERNLGLSNSETCSNEDSSSTRNVTNQNPPRFTIPRPEYQEQLPDNSTKPQVDRTLKKRKSSFWDFPEDGSDDEESPKRLNTQESHVAGVLDLPDGCTGEVYI